MFADSARNFAVYISKLTTVKSVKLSIQLYEKLHPDQLKWMTVRHLRVIFKTKTGNGRKNSAFIKFQGLG